MSGITNTEEYGESGNSLTQKKKNYTAYALSVTGTNKCHPLC